MSKTPHLLKSLAVAGLTVVVLVITFVGLVLYQDWLERECRKVANSVMNGQQDQVLDISAEEKEAVGIDPSLRPMRSHYEMKKCYKERLGKL